MDVELQTHTSEPSLALRQVSWIAGSGFSAVLVVRSRGLGCERPLWFSPWELEQFLVGIRQLDTDLAGEAVLQFDGGPDFVALTGRAYGRVLVNGGVYDSGPDTQQLEFSFETDQTCLRPLTSALEAIRAQVAA